MLCVSATTSVTIRVCAVLIRQETNMAWALRFGVKRRDTKLLQKWVVWAGHSTHKSRNKLGAGPANDGGMLLQLSMSVAIWVLIEWVRFGRE